MRNEARVAKRYLIAGRVQGVGFRFFAVRAAREFGLAGYVTNRADGSVEAYAIGTEASLAAFGERLREGPRASRVTQVTESAEPADEHARDFVIR